MVDRGTSHERTVAHDHSKSSLARTDSLVHAANDKLTPAAFSTHDFALCTCGFNLFLGCSNILVASGSAFFLGSNEKGNASLQIDDFRDHRPSIFLGINACIPLILPQLGESR